MFPMKVEIIPVESDGRSNEQQHIKTIRLFDLARETAGFKLAEEELKHLFECDECKDVVLVFAAERRNT